MFPRDLQQAHEKKIQKTRAEFERVPVSIERLLSGWIAFCGLTIFTAVTVGCYSTREIPIVVVKASKIKNKQPQVDFMDSEITASENFPRVIHCEGGPC